MANASKKTEEELLQETFLNFKTQAETEDPATESPSGNGNGGGKKSNKNLVPLFIVGGVVATCLLGYVLVVKPMIQPAPQQMVQESVSVQEQMPQQQVPQNQASTDPFAQLNQVQAPVAPVPAPVEVVAQAPVAPVPAPVEIVQAPVVQAPAVQVPSLESFQVEVAAQVPAYTQPVVVPAPVEVIAQVPEYTQPVVVPAPVEVTVQAPEYTQPVVVEPVDVVAQAPVVEPVVVPTPVVSTTSDIVVADLVSKFDNQTNEFKSLIGGLDTRVTALEGQFVKQEGVNKGFDERITALEKGKVDKKGVNASASKSKDVSTSREEGKSEVRKSSVTTRTTTRKVSEERIPKKTIIDDGTILVDKNGGKRVQPKSPETPKPVAQKVTLPELKIHSIYGARMWITNPNGTLSTYTEGNVLPTGEVIKEIDDATFTIVTNKRKIVKE